MVVAFLVAAMVAVYSWAMAKEEVFKEFRDGICKPATKNGQLPFLLRKLCYIPTCEYCFSFWFTVLILLVFQYQVWYDDWRGYLLAHGLTWAVAVGYMSIYQLIRVDIRITQAKADKEQQK